MMSTRLALCAAFWAGCALAVEAELTQVRYPLALDVPGDPTLSFILWYQVGSQDDPPGKEGLAYLTAQMLADASTESNSYEDILKKLYPLATSYFARVDREMTTLKGRAHIDTLDEFYTLFRGAYLNPAFKQEDFDRIKSNTLDYLQKTLRYASDEELGKAALYSFVFEGTRYRHPPQGTVKGLQSITLDDVKAFYASHFTFENARMAVGGDLSAGNDAQPGERSRVSKFATQKNTMPAGNPLDIPLPQPEPIEGLQALLIDKPNADASISFGFPIDVHRGEDDFYALWLAVSWLGEHRSSSSHLFQVIREQRGLNYGDYAYIEAYPNGGSLTLPPQNVARRQQLFEVWIRTLPNPQAHFAIRAAMRELKLLVENGLSEEQFETTRSFLSKYILHFADTTMARLGYAVDDAFYGVEGSHLKRFREKLETITRDEVNAAIKKHLQIANVKFAIVTGDAEGLKAALVADAPSPIEYASPKSEDILEEDKAIVTFPLPIDAENVRIVPVDEFLER